MTELEKRIELWKSELLDTGKKNKMINYRDSKLTTLTITEPAADDLFERIAIHEKTLKFMKRIDREADIRVSAMLSLLESLSYPLVVEEGDIRSNTTELERNKTLKNLRSKAKLAQEEQGTNILYLSFGFIYWREKIGASWMKSPLLLVPVSISQASLKAPFTLSRYDDDVVVNPTLEYRFNSEFNITLPSFELGKDSFQEYMDQVESIVDKRGWRLAKNEVSLGLLSFLKISMYHDLDDNRDLILKNPVLQAIAGDKTPDQDAVRQLKDVDFDAIHPKDWHEVIDADSSQEEAIMLSKAGVSFVMQGPPGTGKSQTITNIIAEALADGKKVLFVSEKAAALQVVLKRLTETNLADFCLSLHNYKANKRDIIHNIGDNLYLPEANERSISLMSLTRLMENKKFINAYAAELHTVMEPFGQSVYMAYGKLSQYENATYISFLIPEIRRVTSEQHGTYHHLVADFENALKHLGTKITESPWFGTTTKVGNQAYRNYLMDRTMGLDAELNQIIGYKQQLHTDYRFIIGETWDDLKSAIDEIMELLQFGAFPQSWLTNAQRKALIVKATEQMRQQQDVRRKQEQLHGRYLDGIFEADIASWQKTVADVQAAYQKTGFAATKNDTSLFQYALNHLRQYADLIDQLEQLSRQYHEICAMTARRDVDTVRNVQRIQVFLHEIENKPSYVLTTWFDEQYRRQVEEQLQTAYLHVADQAEKRAALSAGWNEDAEKISEADLRRLVLSVFPSEGGNDLREYAANASEKAGAVLETLEQLLIYGNAAHSILNIDGQLNFESAERMALVLQDLVAITYIEPEWMDLRKEKRLLAELNECIAHAQQYVETKTMILQQWNDCVFTLDIPAISMRFRMKYGVQFSDAMGQYQDDVRLLQSHFVHTGQRVTAESVLALGKTLNELKTLKKQFEDLAVESEVSAYMSLDADWEKLNTFADAKKAKMDEALKEVTAHAQTFVKVKTDLMKTWTSDCFEIDAEQMLSRFTNDYRAFLAHMLNGQYKRDMAVIRAHMRIPTTTPDDDVVIAFLKQVIQGQKELKWFTDHTKEHADTFEIENISPETDWNTIQVQIDKEYRETKDILKRAEELNKQITALTAQIMLDWDHSVLELGADSIIDRFKMVYDYQFYSTLEAYQQDVESLGMASRAAADSITFDAIDILARQLERLHTEEKWFADHESQLRASFGSAYRGLHTEWNVLKNDIAAASRITGYFPYGNISMQTINAICNVVEQMQLSAQVRMLADKLNVNRIHEMKQMLAQMGSMSFELASASVENVILPWIRAKIAASAEQRALLNELAGLRPVHLPLNYAAVEQLAGYLDAIHSHIRWFDENNQNNQEMFGQIYRGDDTDWDNLRQGLAYTKRITDLFDHQQLSDGTVHLSCNGMNGDQHMQYDALLHTDIAALKQVLADVFMPISDTSALNGIVLLLQTVHDATVLLQTVTDQITIYQQSNELDADRIVFELPLIAEIAKMRNKVAIEQAPNAVSFGNRYTGESTDLKQVIADIQHLDRYISKVRKTVTAEHLQLMCAADREVPIIAGADRSELAGLCEQILHLMEQVEPKIMAFAAEFADSVLNPTSTKIADIATRHKACMDHFDALSHWLEYNETRNACEKAGLKLFTDVIVSRDNTVPDVLGAFERGFYTQWISNYIDDIPAVQTFKKNVFESKIAEFTKLDVSQYDIARRRIRQAIINTFPSLDETAPKGSELAILRHEMEKRTRHMPLRKLFQQIPSLLLKLKPCLMMSPLSVAYFLSADQYHFDMVIFDEASQIFPQDAIGAMFRADQVIIAGDTKQMPPTNFFGAGPGGSTDYDDESEEIEELGESILEESEVKLPTRTLQWHYRSQHEHLIAFSNQAIYEGHLVTFPSSNERMKDTGVEFIYVKDGYYESSPKNYNKVEAERIVELIKEHIETHPERSLGVIAFSEKQQQAITAAVQRFREKQNDPRYEQFFAEDKEDEFFIKNLENVQGDERDTILFSVGYARTKKQIADGKPMSMRFGPLGLAGGERRLNVAITRAKINVKLVSSIQPSDIDITRTRSEGIRMLRAYIEFAMHGTSALVQSGQDREHDEFANAIAEFIRANGYEVVQHVGLSGYRIDMAVKHPSELVDLYAVGIECDGYSYSNARTTRDRERLRKSVLTNMGWNMYRVWSTAWFSDPKHEGERLLVYIKKAIADADVKVRAMEAEKRRIEEIKAREARENQLRLERENAERLAHEQKKQEARAAEMRRLEQQHQRVMESRQRAVTPIAQTNGIHTTSVNAQRRSTATGYGTAQVKQNNAATIADYTWAVVGAEVVHRNGSVGRITSINDHYLTASFGAKTMQFLFPDAFAAGYLKKKEQAKAIQNSSLVSTEKVATPNNINVEKLDTSQENRVIDELCFELELNGFRCINDKSWSPLTWVYYDSSKRSLFENIVKNHNVKWHLEKHGTAATGFKSAWCISQ